MQNVSFLNGRKISGSTSYPGYLPDSKWNFTICPTLLRIEQYGSAAFRQTLLAVLLLFVVLFALFRQWILGYIIALMGVAICYVVAPERSKRISLWWSRIHIDNMSPSDLFPKYGALRTLYVYPMLSKPCLVRWYGWSYRMRCAEEAMHPIKYDQYNC